MKKSSKSITGKILKITGLSIAGILLLMFLLPILFPGTVSEKVKNFANKSLDGELNFSKARLSFFSHFPSLTLSLSDFTLKGSAPFKKDTLLSARKIGFGINVRSLLFEKKINIDKIFIDNADIKVQVNKKGEANYNVYVPAKKKKTVDQTDTAGTALKLEKIAIRDSHLVYDDRSTDLLIDAKGFSYTGNGDLDKAIFDLNSHAEIDSLDFYFDNQPYLLNKKVNGNLVTSINTNSFAFYFQQDNLVINKLPVEFSGRLNFLQSGYDLDFTLNGVNTNLDDLITALPPQFITWEQKTKIKGRSDFLLTLKGKYISSLNTMPDLNFNMKIRDGYVAYEGAPFPVKDLFLNLDTKVPSINPDSLLVKIDSVYFTLDNNYLSAVINTKGIHEPYINAKINAQMDLEKLDKAFGFTSMDLKGICDMHLTMAGKYASATSSDSMHKFNSILSVPSFDLKAVIKDGYFKYAVSPIAVTDINLNINGSCADSNYRHVKLNINDLSAKAAGSFIKGHASISNLQEMIIDANLQSAINLADVKKIVPFKQADLAGQLKTNINIKGLYDTAKKSFPVTNADISLQNGVIKTSYYPDPVNDIQLSAKLTNSTGNLKGTALNLQPASFSFEGEPFELRASLQNFEDILYDVKAKGKINVGKIYKVFAIKGQDVSGFINADLSLKGKQSDAMSGRYNKLINSGTLTVNNIKTVSDYLPLPFYIKEGVFKFKEDKMWFDKFLASYGQSDFEMDGYLQNAIAYATLKKSGLKGDFKLRANFINVDEFMSNASSAKSTDSIAVEETAGSEKTASGVVIIPSDLDLNFTAEAKKVSYNGLMLENTKATVSIDKGKMNLTNTGFGLIGCDVLMDAVYQSVNTRKASFESHLQAKEFDIKRAYNEVKMFHDMATAAANAEGIISIDYSLKGSLNENMQPVYPSLVGGGVVSLKNIKMKGFKLLSAVGDKTGKDGIKDPELSKINIKSTIKNNVINVEQFKIKSAGFRLRIEGKTNFDGAIEMKMRLGLPPLGIIGIPMHVTGTQENPIIKLGKGDKEEGVEEAEDVEKKAG